MNYLFIIGGSFVWLLAVLIYIYKEKIFPKNTVKIDPKVKTKPAEILKPKKSNPPSKPKNLYIEYDGEIEDIEADIFDMSVKLSDLIFGKEAPDMKIKHQKDFNDVISINLINQY